jgi:hypothetical protein
MSKIEPREFLDAAKRARLYGLPDVAQLLEETAARVAEGAKQQRVDGQARAQHQSVEIDQLAAALAAAQGEMRHAAKDRENDQLRSRYATLASVIDACREPLSKNGLAVIQRAHEISYLSDVEGRVTVTTLLTHSSGQWVLDVLTVPMERVVSKLGNKQTWIQAIGAAFTYARRYALSAMVGVAAGDDEDDDGNAWDGERRQSNLERAREQAAQAAARKGTDANPVPKPPTTVLFGKHKGKPIVQLSDEAVTEALEEGRKAVADSPKADWVPAVNRCLEVLGAEVERRITASQGKSS